MLRHQSCTASCSGLLKRVDAGMSASPSPYSVVRISLKLARRTLMEVAPHDFAGGRARLHFSKSRSTAVGSMMRLD